MLPVEQHLAVFGDLVSAASSPTIRFRGIDVLKPDENPGARRARPALFDEGFGSFVAERVDLDDQAEFHLIDLAQAE